MSPLSALGQNLVFKNKVVTMHVVDHTVGFILEIAIAGHLSMLDVAYIGQGIRDFLGQSVVAQRHLLFDISDAESMTLSIMEGFASEMKAMRPLFEAHLQSSVIIASSVLLENTLVRQFRRRYQPVRPMLILQSERATKDAVLDFFSAEGTGRLVSSQ